ncbi:MAG: hypothetical protein AAF220_02620 [Pseudomonadota bacterium]
MQKGIWNQARREGSGFLKTPLARIIMIGCLMVSPTSLLAANNDPSHDDRSRNIVLPRDQGEAMLDQLQALPLNADLSLKEAHAYVNMCNGAALYQIVPAQRGVDCVRVHRELVAHYGSYNAYRRSALRVNYQRP